MAKSKLSPKAIACIIECKADQDKVWTLLEIAEKLKDDFGVEVSLSAIRKSYLRNKDNQDILIINNDGNNLKNIVQKPKQVIEQKRQSVIKTNKGFNDEVNEDKLSGYMAQFED